MKIDFREYERADVSLMKDMWNDALEEGRSFPQLEPYTEEKFADILQAETAAYCMLADGELVGYYTLHPNIVGRGSHIANISYLICREFRGRHLGKHLVAHSIEQAKICGFRGIQFNGVGSWNTPAVRLYEAAGFSILATIPGGFLLKDGSYADIYIMYLSLV